MRANYNASACNHERKAARAKTMENRKKQGEEQWKKADIRVSAAASPGHIDSPTNKIARRREAPGAHIQD